MICRNNPHIVCKHDWYCQIYQCDAEKNPNRYSVTEVCLHNVVFLRTISTAVTCETTVEICEACKTILTEPKTDC